MKGKKEERKEERKEEIRGNKDEEGCRGSGERRKK